jgi:hypothetical protein
LGAVFDAAEHAGELGDAFVADNPSNDRRVFGALDDEVAVGEGGDLREVGHHQDLPPASRASNSPSPTVFC